MRQRALATSVLFLLFVPLFTQDLDLGFLPTFNLNVELSESWRLNSKLESRFQDKFSHALTDLAVVASREIGFNNKVAFGAMLRFRNGQTAQRVIQQFTLVRKYDAFRVSHRLASDQTWAKEEPPEVRARYRITAQIPLNGQSVNPREMYLKVGNEYLGSLELQELDLEIRLTPTLGYEFTDQNKIEVGLDYRLGSILQSSARQRMWYSVNWFLAIDGSRKPKP